MVEKIIVNPESIRAYGNIVVPKTGADFEEYNCTMEVSDDTVNGEDVTVYVLTPETTTIALELTSDVSTVTAGGNVVLSVTVTEDEEPVTGQSVSFKLGNDEVGTGTTNSSGVATYTYTTVSSGSLNFSAVYAGHSSNGVSVVVNKKTVTATISASSASIVVGNNVTLTGTVKYNNTGINGIPVTFKEGTTTVGTGTTNSSGVATCTVSDLTVGSHSFTVTSTATDVYDTATSSSTSVTVLDHSYSLAFSQSSYPATSGSATLELTLLDNSVPVSGATVSVTGSDSSVYSCITNSSGVGSVTVSNISAETTFTATYQSVSATCTVTVAPAYLLYDDASVDNSSTLFGNSYALRNSGSNTTGWNSNGYYTVKTHSSSTKESVRILAPLTGITDDFVVEYDSYSEQSDGASGLIIYNSSTAWEKLSDNVDTGKIMWYGYNNGSYHETMYHGDRTTYQRWMHYKFTMQGTSFTMKVTDPEDNDAVVWEHTETIHLTRSSTTQYGLNSEWSANRTTRYKNIKAYKI